MSDPEVLDLLVKSGSLMKFHRAYCRAMGWRVGAQGTPEPWFAAWRTGLGAQIERAVIARTKRP